MDFYHGTVIKDLEVLKPFASCDSNIKESCVYLTTSKQIALHYIWNCEKCPSKMPMLKICDDGTLIFQEMFNNALKYFYEGLNGYIYHCIGDYEINKKAGVNFTATSKETVPINDCEYIENVYEYIMKYEKEGKFIYERYEDLPPYRHDIIRGIAYRIIKEKDLLNNRRSPEGIFWQNKFAKYWDEAEALYKNNLL
jgi:hypothetical protein